MTDYDKQRLNELEKKTAYLLARQDEQEAKMQQILARLTYIENRQYRLMRQLGVTPGQLDTLLNAMSDAETINRAALPQQRWN